MPVKASKRIVVDASIARAAGGEGATFPRSKTCRDFLRPFLNSTHHVVMTDEIEEEWNKHQSGFAHTWRKAMVSRRRLETIEIIVDDHLRRRIEGTATTANHRKAIRKDLRLIEASLATDKTITSLDEEVRMLFQAAASVVSELRRIVWVNPDQAAEEWRRWLEGGAKPERKRLLGYGAKAS
ncbi:MAG: hypothetical protein ABR577_03375 [Pyrinomonadaceae bacterium]